MTSLPEQLPASFATTREALRALACYVVAPFRKARTGRIGLRAGGQGFATPPLPDGTRVIVSGDRLAVDPAVSIRITTLRAAAGFLGIPLSADPGVGADLPRFDPDAQLPVDADASFALGAWYAFADHVLRGLAVSDAAVSEAQLWPEHFDLAVQIELHGGATANVGFSPGDPSHDNPYAYVGPHDTVGLSGSYWNAPFGAVLAYDDIRSAPSPELLAEQFIAEGIDLLGAAGGRPVSG